MLKILTKKSVIFIAVIGLLIFLHFIKALSPVEFLIIKALNPIMSSFYSASSSTRIAYNDQQTDKSNLLERISELEDEVINITTDNVKLKKLEEENKILRKYLQFTNDKPQKHVISNIVSRGALSNTAAQNNVIIIDKGENDGLMPGLAVLNHQGIVIGKIVNVKSDLAEVHLITNPACKLAAAIQNSNKTIGIVQGQLDLTAIMEFVPQTENINTGDIVITSGLENNIPLGLIIGKVTEIKKESNEIWQSLIVESLIDLDELKIVSVLLP
jgi:rod shape-determining protein MreC